MHLLKEMQSLEKQLTKGFDTVESVTARIILHLTLQINAHFTEYHA